MTKPLWVPKNVSIGNIMRYYSFNQYLRERFGTRVRKIGLNAGFTCPNRDGAISADGCIFCNELGFSATTDSGLSLEEQIEAGKKAINKHAFYDKYIAYFQNGSGTNASLEKLRSTFDTIRKYPEIVGLYISTRPDCVDDEKLDLIAEYTKDYDVWVEYGIQTVHDKTLKFINRGHTFSQTEDAVFKTAYRGIKVGAHIILGLPGESKEDMISTARKLSDMPVSGVKLHMLHVLKDTPMEDMYRSGDLDIPGRNDYVARVCDFLEALKQDCVILRLASDADENILVAPLWMNDKISIIKQIQEELDVRDTRQGDRYFN